MFLLIYLSKAEYHKYIHMKADPERSAFLFYCGESKIFPKISRVLEKAFEKFVIFFAETTVYSDLRSISPFITLILAFSQLSA